MTIRYPDDAMLPSGDQTDPRPAQMKPAVFLPIVIALAGVAAVLLGGLPARDPATAISRAGEIDPVVTGSVQPTAFAEMSAVDQRHALEMLDR